MMSQSWLCLHFDAFYYVGNEQEHLEVPIESPMPLPSESVGIVTSQGHDVYRGGVVGHADPSLGSVLCVVVGHHQ